MTARMPRTAGLSLAAVTLTAVALVTGCTGGLGAGGAPSPSASAPANQVVAMRAASACLRSHGYPGFPDPVQDQSGNWGWPDSAPKTRATPCDDLTRRAKSLGRPRDKQKVSAADLATLRRYSACMREHGLPDWPDPTTVGVFKLPTRLQPPAGEPLIRPADRACAKLLGRVGVTVDRPA